MERSKFLSLNTRDFMKGLFAAFFSTLLLGLMKLFSGETISFAWATFQPILYTSISAMFGYISTKFLQNSEGKMLTPEGK